MKTLQAKCAERKYGISEMPLQNPPVIIDAHLNPLFRTLGFCLPYLAYNTNIFSSLALDESLTKPIYQQA